MRKQAKNPFESDLFKLMNNAVFGKSIEDQRNRLNMKLCLNEKQAEKYLIKPNYESFLILDEDKVLVNIRKQKVMLNRPIYIGFACLEYSKHLMYSTYYKQFKAHYGDNVTLCYTDTDSLVMAIKTDDYYCDLQRHFTDIMDLSNYPKDHFLYDDRYGKVVGRFKDELAGSIIEEFIALKPKLYSILYNDGRYKNRAKGVQKSVLKRTITHQDYKDVLFRNRIIDSQTRRIQSKDHQLSTIESTKRVFQPFEDKRYYLDDGIHSLAFGHYKINSNL